MVKSCQLIGLSVLLWLSMAVVHAQPNQSSDPVLRPGDVLWLGMPNEESFNLDVTVNRNGMITVPEVGQIQVAGMTLSAAEAQIKNQLKDLFVDLSGFDITLSQRRLMLQVLGYVKKPGSVDLSSSATIQEAITQAGGLLPGAQLNRIQLRRGNEVTTFDYKHYLDSGDSSSLPQLQSLDTVFVPASELFGNVQMSFDAALKAGQAGGDSTAAIQILGEVKKPGHFDWQESLTLLDLLSLSGGPGKDADLASISIISSKDGKLSNQKFDLAGFISKGGLVSSIPTLSPGDTIMVPSMALAGNDDKSQWVKQAPEDSIYIMGEVSSPGRYRFNNRMHLLDLLAAAKGPNDKADIHNIRITHRNGQNSTVSQVDLGRYFESGDESLLPRVKTGDVIYVPAKNRIWLNHHKDETIRVLGAVNRQGRYRFAAPMTLLDLLARAGGLSNTADTSNIVVVKGHSGETQVRHFDLLDFADHGNMAALPSLTTGDTVYVLNKQDSYWNRVVENIQDTLSVLSVLKILGAG